LNLLGELLTAGGGFLLAVLWFDLIFDAQALSAPREGPLPEEVLASIADYYRRVTTDANPMGRLVGLAMMATIVILGIDLFVGSAALVWRVLSIPLLVGPVLLAARRVYPNAQRLGARKDPIEEQSRLARSIARDHLVCLASIVAFLAIQLFG
jgi:ribose/xylose/arabinose/galactoside ABC-type transport system permease subunit